VINLSLGNDVPVVDVTGLGTAVDYAWSHGAVIVAAAGNSTSPLCGYPAASAHAICVAATDSSGFPSFYSNFPLRLDGGVAVRAPGGDGSGDCGPDADIWSTYWPGASGADAEACPPTGYEPLAGTSMATPFVSGIAALLRGAGLSNQQVVDCIKRTSSNGGNYDPIFGYGIVNAEAAVAGCTQLAVTGNPFGLGGATGQSEGSPTGTQQPGSGQVQGTQSADTTAPRIRLAIPKRTCRLQPRPRAPPRARTAVAADPQRAPDAGGKPRRDRDGADGADAAGRADGRAPPQADQGRQARDPHASHAAGDPLRPRPGCGKEHRHRHRGGTYHSLTRCLPLKG
jgi:hypothetical protein